MRIIICLDDRDGFLFNNRRQSMDRMVHRDMVEYVSQNRLWMSNYSYKNFTVASENCHANDAYADLMQSNDYCFAEDRFILDNLQRADEIIIYRWDRTYPSDVKFSAEILENWNLVEKFDFSGYSHEKITREVYRR